VKVLHVLPTLSPQAGGPTEVALNLARNLNQKGLDVEIITTNDNDSDCLTVNLGERLEYQGVPVRFFQRSLRFKQYLPSRTLSKWLWQNICHYDLLDLHYLFSFAPSVAACIARHYSIPYTMRVMGQLTPWALAQSHFRKRIYSQLIEHKNLNCAAAIHCTTQGEAQDVTNFGIQTPKLILPLGVCEPARLSHASTQLKQTYNIAPDLPVILFLSRLHYKKRPDLLIEAVSQLSFSVPKTHLVLAGSGEIAYDQYLRDCVEKAGLRNQVTFTGFVTGREKSLLLQGADLFVLPSFSENFGIAVAEALAAGLPVIITKDVQIAPDVEAAHAGLIIDSDLESLRSALEKLLTSPELRKAMGANARWLAQTQYHWPTITQNLIQAYEEILRGEFHGNFP
jgi:glycosyltransferase involved in cell wall biosynthesis